jgi:hypothetical protein
MNPSEEFPGNDAIGEVQNDGSAAVDDIFVPGVGVRGVLADDEPAGSALWPPIRAGWERYVVDTRVREKLRGAAVRLKGGLADARLKSAVALRSGLGMCRQKLLVLAISIWNCTRHIPTELGRGVTASSRQVSLARASISQACSGEWPLIRARGARISHHARGLLESVQVGSGAGVRQILEYKPKLRLRSLPKLSSVRFPAVRRPTLALLRRAAPALAILAVVVVFVAQQIWTEVRR